MTQQANFIQVDVPHPPYNYKNPWNQENRIFGDPIGTYADPSLRFKTIHYPLVGATLTSKDGKEYLVVMSSSLKFFKVISLELAMVEQNIPVLTFELDDNNQYVCGDKIIVL